jgi:hypothetical protein
VYTFLACICLLRGLTFLHLAAQLLLASGTAIQVTRWMAKHPCGAAVLVRFTLGWTAVFSCLSRQKDPRAFSQHPSPALLPQRRQLLLSTGGGCLAWQRAPRPGRRS